MREPLAVRFVDGTDVHLDSDLAGNKIVMIAFDTKTRQRCRLTFASCMTVMMNYASESAELSDLNDGVAELEPVLSGERIFQIDFADESRLEIHCKDFALVRIKPITPYRDMVQLFLAGEITIGDLCDRCKMEFEANPSQMDAGLYRLVRSFLDILTAYSPPGLLIKGASNKMSEQTFQQEAEKALTRLNEYLLDHPE